MPAVRKTDPGALGSAWSARTVVLRREREHQAALEQARTQAVLTLRTRSEELSDATRVVRELTHDLVVGREFGVSVEHHDLIAAIRDFADVMDAQTIAAAPTLN